MKKRDGDPESSAFTITIEIRAGEKVAIVRDSAGNTKTLSGLALFGQEEASSDLYSIVWGQPNHAAIAVGRTLAMAINADDEYYLAFYKCLCMDLHFRTRYAEEISANELLGKLGDEKKEVFH